MKIIKVCNNPDCKMYLEKLKNDDFVTYCPKCEQPHIHVCKGKGCYTFLRFESDKYCRNCKAKKADKRDKNVDRAKKVGVAIGGLGISALGILANLITNDNSNIKKK